MKPDRILLDVYFLVMDSKRSMPAHFTSDKTRNQTFMVDFLPLTPDDEYNMASEAWYSMPGMKSYEELKTVLRTGEDIMIGSYILTKIGSSKLADKLMEFIIASHLGKLKPTLDEKSDIFSIEIEHLFTDDLKLIVEITPFIKKYLIHCKDFGIKKANPRSRQ